MPLTKEDLEKQAEDLKVKSMQIQGAFNLVQSQIKMIEEQEEQGKNEQPEEVPDGQPEAAT